MEWADRIGRRLKLRDLHLLMTVVQRGSMAKAATELAVSQPAVSKAIADMEHTLGLRLLDRGRNGIEPTAYGRALVKRGLTIFDELKQGIEELEFLADASVGSLRIGSTESIAAGMLPAIIERFWREHPGVRLDVAQAVISTLHYRELRERSIDLLIGRIPTPFAEDDLEADVVYDDQVVVVAGRKSKWRAYASSSSPTSVMSHGFCRQPIQCPARWRSSSFAPAALRCRARPLRRSRFICPAGSLRVAGSSPRYRYRSCALAAMICLSRFCRSSCPHSRGRSGL
jgi:DNA-binding transcriptional LysR family regulator